MVPYYILLGKRLLLVWMKVIIYLELYANLHHTYLCVKRNYDHDQAVRPSNLGDIYESNWHKIARSYCSAGKLNENKDDTNVLLYGKMDW